MQNVKKTPIYLLLMYIVFVLAITEMLYFVARDTGLEKPRYELILTADGYDDQQIEGVWNKLVYRVKVQPFNILALGLFLMAVTHTFFSHKLAVLSHWLIELNARKTGVRRETFGSEILHFMSEVEVVFGIWVIPLMVIMSFVYDWSTALHYLNNRSYTEPIFVVVIMALAQTKPIFKVAEDSVKAISRLGGGSVKAWWLTILTVGPLLGSFITEPGAMTISAMLLGKQFFRLKPSLKMAYATLGLLFVNISIGGVFTNFAAPAVLMVSKAWHWDTAFMASHFGWKAVIGILISNIVYFTFFRSEFDALEKKKKFAESTFSAEESEKEDVIPFWISLFHLVILAWTVVHSHYPVIFIGTFLIFLGFYRATLPYQTHLNLKTPILVGFFLAGLIVHGGLQAWWIGPILSDASSSMIMVISTILTAFNDNAEITYLATLVPGFTDAMKYAVVAGAVTGGGLTVIANAPNPAGQAILGKYFPDGIAPLYLLLAAITPTIIVGGVFYVFGILLPY
ncbi:MAG: hypothetical protein K940chlam3_00075 [Chlamydiae bacterium]|nr:hypothetical protein [Chlamydiota bacterium]